jgi:hypothetical protein
MQVFHNFLSVEQPPQSESLQDLSHHPAICIIKAVKLLHASRNPHRSHAKMDGLLRIAA